MLCRVENKFMDTGTMKVDSFGAYKKVSGIVRWIIK